jgi:hypothetical protein
MDAAQHEQGHRERCDAHHGVERAKQPYQCAHDSAQRHTKEQNRDDSSAGAGSKPFLIPFGLQKMTIHASRFLVHYNWAEKNPTLQHINTAHRHGQPLFGVVGAVHPDLYHILAGRNWRIGLQ